MSSPVRTIFLINNLSVGGAERQLVELVRQLDKTEFEINVITFYHGGALRPQIESMDNISVYSLGKKGRYGWGRPLFRLYQLVRRIRPQIIHGYMGVANELALFMGRLFGAKVIMGVRASNIRLEDYTFLSRCSFQTGIWASKFADLVIYNSYVGRDYHLLQGYNTENAVVVHNGIDTVKFRPDDKLRQQIRQEWEIADNVFLIGIVARIDPMKGHEVFLKAAQLMMAQHPHVRFICIGDGAPSLKQALYQLSGELGLQNHIIWAGQRTDMPAVHNALDLLVMASIFGEGFPNAVGEAMACGTPCIVTDVGDAAYIVDDSAMVVPLNDAAALAEKCLNIIQCDTAHLQSHAAKHIRDNFTVKRLADETAGHLLSVVNKQTI